MYRFTDVDSGGVVALKFRQEFSGSQLCFSAARLIFEAWSWISQSSFRSALGAFLSRLFLVAAVGYSVNFLLTPVGLEA